MWAVRVDRTLFCVHVCYVCVVCLLEVLVVCSWRLCKDVLAIWLVHCAGESVVCLLCGVLVN